MAKIGKTVLGKALAVLVLTSVGALASEVGQASKPLIGVLDLADGTGSYQAGVPLFSGQFIQEASPAISQPGPSSADTLFVKSLFGTSNSSAVMAFSASPSSTSSVSSSSALQTLTPAGSSANGVSSDAAACNMVASWAGTSGWSSFSDGAAGAASVGCNAKQWSTIASLEGTKQMGEIAVLQIGGSSESVFIGDTIGNPEPGTWAMMAGGLALLGYARRTRRTTARQ